MDLIRERMLMTKKASDADMKRWKKVKVFEDLAQESSVTFDEPYTELIIISENIKGESGSQLMKFLNGQMVSGQNGDISSTIGFNCIDIIK